MKTWVVLLMFIQIGYSIRFEFYQLDDLIAIANNETYLADHVNKSRNNRRNLNDATSQERKSIEDDDQNKKKGRIFNNQQDSGAGATNLYEWSTHALLIHIIDMIF